MYRLIKCDLLLDGADTLMTRWILIQLSKNSLSALILWKSFDGLATTTISKFATPPFDGGLAKSKERSFIETVSMWSSLTSC